MSLLKKIELVHTINLSQRQEELYPLLERQVKLYTMGDSSSLPAETAQGLLRSVCFCIETHLTFSGKSADGYPLVQLFEEGQRDVWRLTEEAKSLFDEAKRTDPSFGSIAYRGTLDEVEIFFRMYNLRFFSHAIPCMIDYPLCHPVPESLEGVRYIGEYLRRLILENRFCGCLTRQDAIRLLIVHHPEFRELVINLFEPIFACALGLALLNRDTATLRLDSTDCDRLYRLFRPWNEARARTWLREAVNRLCIRFRLWDTGMRCHLMDTAEDLFPRLKTTTREGYRGLFSIVSEHKM